MPPVVYVYGVLVKMIVFYQEAVQLCYSLNDTLSQTVHLAIIAGLNYSHFNRCKCIKLEVLIVLFKSMTNKASLYIYPRQQAPVNCWGGWGCEVSCGGHHRPKGKTTTGSAMDGAVFDIAQILAYLVHNMSRSQLYLGFGHFGWLPSFFGQ